MAAWLMKTEPGVYSIDDLKKHRKTFWEGVRNYQARNYMRDDMKVGDEVLIHHSNANPPGIAGLGKITKEAVPDPHALDPKSPYYREKATAENNPWVMVEVSFVDKFKEVIPIDTLRATKGLQDMLVLKKGMRLSIQPVTAKQYRTLVQRFGHLLGG